MVIFIDHKAEAGPKRVAVVAARIGHKLSLPTEDCGDPFVRPAEAFVKAAAQDTP